MLFGLVIQAMANGQPLSVAFAILPYLLPQSIANCAPAVTAFAISLSFIPMAQQGEITAFKVVGAPLWKIIFPIYLGFICLSIVSVKINDFSNSIAREKRNQTIVNKFEKIVISQLKKERTYTDPSAAFTLDVADVAEDGALINPSFRVKKNDITGVAEKASLKVLFRGDTPYIVLDFYNSEVIERTNEFVFPKEFHQEIPLEEIYNKKTRVDPKASEVAQAVKRLETERSAYRRQMAAKACFAFLCGNVDDVSKEEWQELQSHEKGFKKRYNSYKIVEPRNWAFGFSYFFAAWAAIPLAIFYPRIDLKIKKIKLEIPAFAAIPLVVIIIFYCSWGIFYDGAKRGVFPPSFVWFGDLILGIIGTIYLKKIH